MLAPGTRVRFTQARLDFLENCACGPITDDTCGCKDHLDEFGDQVGTVVEKDPDIRDWPEAEVRWDTGFFYMYDEEHLEVVG